MKTKILIACLLLAGCSKSPSTFTPLVTSPVPTPQVVQDAQNWVNADPANRYYALTADTHSMEPFYTSKSVTLLLKYTGQIVPNGTVAVYDRGDSPHVMHVVSAQSGDSFYMSGYNNRNSDGWFSKSKVQGIVVGQLYTP